MPGKPDVFGRVAAAVVTIITLAVLLFHAAVWPLALRAVWREGTGHYPIPPSLAVLALGAVIIVASKRLRRPARRNLLVGMLALTMVSFVFNPIPPLRFQNHGYMNDGADNIADRD